jgi:DoxX-like family
MTKTNKIIYWIATVWLSLGMAVSGVMQIIQPEEQMAEMKHLGYPAFFFTLLGTWKILGVIAVLMPKTPLLKEWAYAGFFFTATGAIITHLAVGDEPMELFGPTLLLALTITSWFLRPASRKVSVQ